MASVHGRSVGDYNEPVAPNRPVRNNFTAGDKTHTVNSKGTSSAGREDHVAQSVFDTMDTPPIGRKNTNSKENLDTVNTPLLSRRNTSFDTMDTPPVSRHKTSLNTMDTRPLSRKAMTPQEKYEAQWKSEGRWQESDEGVKAALSPPSKKEFVVMHDPDNNENYYLAVRKNDDVYYISSEKADFIRHVSAYKTEQKIGEYIRSCIPYTVTSSDLEKIAEGKTVLDRLKNAHDIPEIEKGTSSSQLTAEDALEILAKIVGEDPSDKGSVKKAALKATRLTNTDHDSSRDPKMDTLLRALINTI